MCGHIGWGWLTKAGRKQSPKALNHYQTDYWPFEPLFAMFLSASRDPSAPGRALLLALLGRRLRIVIADGRLLIGKFACTDRHSNIILRNADEYSPEPAPTGHADTQAATLTRSLGMIVIPGKHIRSVAVLEEGAQKVSGP